MLKKLSSVEWYTVSLVLSPRVSHFILFWWFLPLTCMCTVLRFLAVSFSTCWLLTWQIWPTFFFFFCHTHGMWKFQGQGLNLCHSNDNTRSLTHCATRKLQIWLAWEVFEVVSWSWCICINLRSQTIGMFTVYLVFFRLNSEVSNDLFKRKQMWKNKSKKDKLRWDEDMRNFI